MITEVNSNNTFKKSLISKNIAESERLTVKEVKLKNI